MVTFAQYRKEENPCLSIGTHLHVFSPDVMISWRVRTIISVNLCKITWGHEIILKLLTNKRYVSHAMVDHKGQKID